jgi:hypothetical protein
MTAQDYRRRAAQCFRLARGAVSFEVAHTLTRLGAEYETLARDAENTTLQGHPLEHA